MPKSVNKVLLLGHVGKDAELKYTPAGTAVATVSLAINERWKDKSGEWKDRVEWHALIFWQRLAEIAAEYVKKGDQIFVEGRLQTRSWEDNSGQKHYKTEIVVRDLVLLGSGRGKSEPEEVHGYTHHDDDDFDQSPKGRQGELPRSHSEPAKGAIDDSEIPF